MVVPRRMDKRKRNWGFIASYRRVTVVTSETNTTKYEAGRRSDRSLCIVRGLLTVVAMFELSCVISPHHQIILRAGNRAAASARLSTLWETLSQLFSLKLNYLVLRDRT